ncbi:MFS transporter [Blastococcus sp. CT_GayMR19]|uniref:MFS transporter n=1 Tax=Blastococcus sp. CT_GayMR19 TaxID=2559608 RepID=UPI00142FD0BA|nr:MFS transporter [Blastococcus sp. CT_GayMR19]
MRRARAAVRHARDRTFRSLREPNYRRYFTGQAVSVAGTWMQRVAQDWLVLTLTGSGVALGIATALQFGPLLVLGLWAGAVVDRLNRRRLIIVTQTIQAVLAATLAVLTLTGTVELWMVYALALALGIVNAFDTPARQAFVGEMVEPENYVNAQALSSTIHNAGRLVGPAIAGILIATTDVGVAFAVNALSFVGVLIGLLRIDAASLRPVTVPESGKGAARAGLRYVLAKPELRAALLLIGVIALFGQNFRVVLPLLAQDTFRSGAEVYGYLTAALGLGAVVGALFSASRETATSWGLLLSCMAFGAINLVAAAAPSLTAAYLAMAAIGFANIIVNTLGRTVLQLGTDPSMHGRVLALHGLVFLGSTPIGGPLLGWICETFGARAGLVVAGGTALAAAVVLLPRLRRLRRAPAPEPEPEQASESPPADPVPRPAA